jgi:hypothetical protein
VKKLSHEIKVPLPIEKHIFVIRREKVMLDSDLATLYGVETKVLLQSVKRNLDRFPADFMFHLTLEEFNFLRSHFVTSKRGGRRYLPYAFTEQGVAMLSSVLNSERAIQVNVEIIRTFVRQRRMIDPYEELRIKLEKLERQYDNNFKMIFEVINELMVPPDVKHRPIGFDLKPHKKKTTT